MEVETKAGWVIAVQQLGKAVGENSGGEVTSNDITDATGVGKDVITAATQEAARAAIGAGTSDFSGSYADLSNKPTIPAAATVDNLGGAGTTGKVVMKATNAEAARAAIGAVSAEDIPEVPVAPTWNTLSGKPTTFPPTIGTTAETAKAGNYTPTTNEVSASLKAKAEIAALTEIADPTTATPEDVATAVNAIIAALKA